jgi:hypothetical protein
LLALPGRLVGWFGALSIVTKAVVAAGVILLGLLVQQHMGTYVAVMAIMSQWAGRGNLRYRFTR